jgi:insertion element IS1 protein InsB
MLGRMVGSPHTLVYRWIRAFGEVLPKPVVSGDITEMEFDEMGHLIGKKKKLWVLKAVDRGTRRTVDWVLGNRNTATFRQLYDKEKHLATCTFYTDAWEAFAKVLPSERHVIGKEHTGCIERDNSNTRHHLGRCTRRTKVVPKCKEMVDYALRIWHAVTTTELFNSLQGKLMAIFRAC